MRCGVQGTDTQNANGCLDCCVCLPSDAVGLRLCTKDEVPVTALCQCVTMCHPAGAGRFEQLLATGTPPPFTPRPEAEQEASRRLAAGGPMPCVFEAYWSGDSGT